MPITAPTPIDDVPVPVPSTDDPSTFDARADATLGWLPDGVDQMNDLADNVYENAQEVQALGESIEETATAVEAAAMAAAEAAGLVATSTSTLTVAAGTKVIHFGAAKPLLAALNKRVAIIQTADPTIRMFGTIAVTDNSDDIEVTVVSGGVVGSGSFSSWTIMDAAFLGAAATAPELWAETSDASAVTPKSIKDAKVWVALTDASTVTPNGLNGRNFTWTITADRTLGAIINTSPGTVFWIEIVQNATGGWDIAWAGAYKRVGGLPTLAQTAGQKTYLQIKVISVDGAGTMTNGIVTAAANPTT